MLRVEGAKKNEHDLETFFPFLPLPPRPNPLPLPPPKNRERPAVADRVARARLRRLRRKRRRPVRPVVGDAAGLVRRQRHLLRLLCSFSLPFLPGLVALRRERQPCRGRLRPHDIRGLLRRGPPRRAAAERRGSALYRRAVGCVALRRDSAAGAVDRERGRRRGLHRGAAGRGRRGGLKVEVLEGECKKRGRSGLRNFFPSFFSQSPSLQPLRLLLLPCSLAAASLFFSKRQAKGDTYRLSTPVVKQTRERARARENGSDSVDQDVDDDDDDATSTSLVDCCPSPSPVPSAWHGDEASSAALKSSQVCSLMRPKGERCEAESRLERAREA